MSGDDLIDFIAVLLKRDGRYCTHSAIVDKLKEISEPDLVELSKSDLVEIIIKTGVK